MLRGRERGRLLPLAIADEPVWLRVGEHSEAASVSIKFGSSPDQGAETRSRIAVFPVVWQITFVARPIELMGEGGGW